MTELTYFDPDGEFDGEAQDPRSLGHDQIVAMIAARSLPGKADGKVSGYVLAHVTGDRPFVVNCAPILEVT